MGRFTRQPAEGQTRARRHARQQLPAQREQSEPDVVRAAVLELQRLHATKGALDASDSGRFVRGDVRLSNLRLVPPLLPSASLSIWPWS